MPCTTPVTTVPQPTGLRVGQTDGLRPRAGSGCGNGSWLELLLCKSFVIKRGLIRSTYKVQATGPRPQRHSPHRWEFGAKAAHTLFSVSSCSFEIMVLPCFKGKNSLAKSDYMPYRLEISVRNPRSRSTGFIHCELLLRYRST